MIMSRRDISPSLNNGFIINFDPSEFERMADPESDEQDGLREEHNVVVEVINPADLEEDRCDESLQSDGNEIDEDEDREINPTQTLDRSFSSKMDGMKKSASSLTNTDEDFEINLKSLFEFY